MPASYTKQSLNPPCVFTNPDYKLNLLVGEAKQGDVHVALRIGNGAGKFFCSVGLFKRFDQQSLFLIPASAILL
jgi:hypothetical protein